MTVKAALLDAAGVFLRVEELTSKADLTPRHIAKITQCDLPSGRYKWIADPSNKQYGGAFWPLTYLAAVDKTKHEAADAEALAAFVKTRSDVPLRKRTDRPNRRKG